MKRCIVLTGFDNRQEQTEAMLTRTRAITSLPIEVFADNVMDLPVRDVNLTIVKPLWVNRSRWPWQNSNYWRIKAMFELQDKYDSFLYLDDDMQIVNPDFVQGFDLAEKFGMCVVISARSFVGVDAAVGANSAGPIERLTRATNYLTSPIFACMKNPNTQTLLSAYLDWTKLQSAPERGPLILWKAVEKTGICPFVLPLEWCVCEPDAHRRYSQEMLIEPIMLHIGHPAVLNWFQTDDIFKDYR